MTDNIDGGEEGKGGDSLDLWEKPASTLLGCLQQGPLATSRRELPLPARGGKKIKKEVAK